jgi:hypothetical protein
MASEVFDRLNAVQYGWGMYDEDDRTLWAKTKYGPITIPIYLVPRKLLECQGCTYWHHGRMSIDMAAELSPNLFDRTLLHEFVHVIEHLNDDGWLSSVTENECTALAQTMEEGMYQLTRNLKQVGVKKKVRKKKRA